MPPSPPSGNLVVLSAAGLDGLVAQAIAHLGGWHWDEPRRTALVSMADWDGTLAVPAVAFVAYESVHHGLRLVAPAYDPERLMHADARGCVFDLCETRRDVETKLRAGHLCLAGAHALEAAGVATPRALRLVDAIRFLAGSAAVVH